jgi:hypothetical protein
MDERWWFFCVIRNPMTKFDSRTQIAGDEIHVWVVSMRASIAVCDAGSGLINKRSSERRAS